jgi:hypothetical protein
MMLTLIKSLLSSTRSLMIIALAGVGLSCGLVPEFIKESNSLSFSFAVSAQTNFNDQQLTNFARAVLAMEGERQTTYDAIKKIAGTVPEIPCYENSNNTIQPITRNNLRSRLQSSLTQLNGSQLNQVVDQAFNYCRTAQQIVHDSGLSAQEFNNITNNWQQLQNRLNPIFIRLQSQ